MVSAIDVLERIAEFTRGTAVFAVGVGTLYYLEAVLTDLERQLVCIQGWHMLSKKRELYLYAGWLSELPATRN